MSPHVSFNDPYIIAEQPALGAQYDAELQEAADREALRQVVTAYLAQLAANETLLVNGIATLKGASPPATIAALRTYVTVMAEMTLDHNRGIDQLIRYLVRIGVIG